MSAAARVKTSPGRSVRQAAGQQLGQGHRLPSGQLGKLGAAGEPVRDDDRVFETYWTTRRGVQVMDNSYPLMDLTVWGRQETHEDSPEGWPQPWTNEDGRHILRTDGRPIAQWSRIEAGRSDDLGAAS